MADNYLLILYMGSVNLIEASRPMDHPMYIIVFVRELYIYIMSMIKMTLIYLATYRKVLVNEFTTFESTSVTLTGKFDFFRYNPLIRRYMFYVLYFRRFRTK